MTDRERLAEWHLDRRVSIALILMLCAQIATAAWYASKTDSRISTLEEHYFELAADTTENRQFQIDQRVRVWERVNAQSEAQNEFGAQMARLEAQLDYISRALDRLTMINDQRIRDESRTSK